MIDAHVHAFPAVSQTVAEAVARTFGKRAAEIVRSSVAPAARSAGEHAWRRIMPLLPSGPALDIERVAAVKREVPRAHRYLEAAGSVALLPPVVLGGTVEGLLASMNRHGIAQSVLIGARGAASNAWLLGEACRQGAGRLVPVATLPELPADAKPSEWLSAYEALARDGARGFKIHSNWDGIDATHPAIAALFEVAQAHRLFVILHTGCFHVLGYKRTSAVDVSSFRRFFDAFPAVRVCLAHMGRDQPEHVWASMKRYEQLYADTSWQTEESIAHAIATVGSDRLMLGSDWPLLHLELQGDAIARAKAAAKGGALEDLFERSARRFLGEGNAEVTAA